ncbi:MAG: YdeI/OmpD-associated family protein [Candidatus Margulisiibacteriota bacterium]
MPTFVRAALKKAGLQRAYQQRPPYQKNDYIGWIMGAKLPATREKRLKQMISELKGGKLYMKMRWKA